VKTGTSSRRESGTRVWWINIYILSKATYKRGEKYKQSKEQWGNNKSITTRFLSSLKSEEVSLCRASGCSVGKHQCLQNIYILYVLIGVKNYNRCWIWVQLVPAQMKLYEVEGVRNPPLTAALSCRQHSRAPKAHSARNFRFLSHGIQSNIPDIFHALPLWERTRKRLSAENVIGDTLYCAIRRSQQHIHIADKTTKD